MYPKAFFDQHAVKPVAGTCFVIMPFAKAFTPTFKAIQRSIEKNLGFLCTRTDELLGGGNIIEDILRGIASSELIVADVTGRNANVYYELGIAHMSKEVEKVILLSQDVYEIPFDLRQFRHIIYKPGIAGLNALSRRLGEAVSAISKPVHRIHVDEHGRGSLPEKLMGPDHCLYEFRIEDGFVGHRSAKFRIHVVRHIMDKGHRSEVAFSGGMGLMLGERRPIDSGWEISLETAPNGETCYRIYEPTIPLGAKPARRRSPRT
jgi:hypothetical protein